MSRLDIDCLKSLPEPEQYVKDIYYLAESQAQSMLTERMRERQFNEIRATLNQAEKIETVTTANLIAAIRKILDEDVPF